MSGFCVYGMTEALAKALAARKSPPRRDDGRDYAPDEIAAWRAEQAENILTKGKARQLSGLMDAPQFCQDWITLAQRTTRASRLKVMVRDVKRDEVGNPILSKKTKRPMPIWRPY